MYAPLYVPLMILLGAGLGYLLAVIAGVRPSGQLAGERVSDGNDLDRLDPSHPDCPKGFSLILSCVAAAALGVGLCVVWSLLRPQQFQQLFDWDTWFEWLPLALSPYVMLILPRSLLVPALGFVVGLVARGPKRIGLLPVAVFAAAVGVSWLGLTERLPSGVTTQVYVYRLDDVPHGDPAAMDEWDKQSDEWIRYLDFNFVNRFGYESFHLDWLDSDSMKERLGGEVKMPPGQKRGFVAVKEYRRDGKVVGTTREVAFGYQTSAQLKQLALKVARRRISLQ